MADNNNQQINTNMIDVEFSVGGQILKLGTLPEQEAFEYYSQLTGTHTPYPVCREVEVQLITPKVPGISRTTLKIVANVTRTCPLCNRKHEGPNNFYAEECTIVLKKGTCPDPFIQLVTEKFFNEKTKEG